MPSVKKIIKDYLVEHGYDGLYSPNGGCACEISDLVPCCGSGIEECRTGYKVDCDCGDHNWHIQEEKPDE